MTGTFRVAHCQTHCRTNEEQTRSLISLWFILLISYMMLQQQRKDSWMNPSSLKFCSRGEGQVRSTHVQLLVEGGTWEKKIKINAKETALLNYFSEE